MSTAPAQKRQRVESAMIQPSKADCTKPQHLYRGAEAVITKTDFLGRPAVIKHRLAKRYRHPDLDTKLRSRRLAQEARVLLRLRKVGIRVPAIYSVDIVTSSLTLEYIEGPSLKDFLHDTDPSAADAVLRDAGRNVARMHRADIVHGDLTTGNILVLRDGLPTSPAVCLIDFGLSHGNGTDEDLAVDLYVLERAIISAHAQHAATLNTAFVEAYAAELQRPTVLVRLDEVRARGRKRDMTG